MNKKLYSLILAVLTLTGFMSSCSSKEDIVFDHERQQFETRADRILLEYIAPFGTTTSDEIYITGAFNDWDTSGDPQWLLTKAPASDTKWGIYLDPTTFIPGTSLGDGFRFYSKAQGQEVTLTGEYAIHNDNPSIGTFTNIWGQRWEAYYWAGGEAPEPEHDGFCIYVDDQTGWDALALYAWGDAEVFGSWPGASVKGTWKHEGVTWKYFDFGEANTGLTEHLIFNNGGNGVQLADFDFTINRNVYVKITPEGVEEISTDEPVPPTTDGFAVYIDDQTGWDAIALYMWGDVNNLNGDWPGMQVSGTWDYQGVTWKYFEMGEANTGLSEHLIFNNNNQGTQLNDFDFTIDRNVFLRVTPDGVEELDIPFPSGGGSKIPHDGYVLYVLNESSQTDLALYAWGDTEAFGTWPGMAPTGTETIKGVEYIYFDLGEANTGLDLHLIPNNNNNGVQWEGDDLEFIIDHDIYIRIADGDKTAYEVLNVK
jgi:hypothetical protein